MEPSFLTRPEPTRLVKSCHDSQSVSYAEWWRILWKLHDRDPFLSSGFDGFMREFVFLKDRVRLMMLFEDTVAAITEFVSVGMHAMNRLLTLAHSKGADRRYWDGSLALWLQYYQLYFTESEIVVINVIGKSWNSSHLPKNAITDNYSPADLAFDHALNVVVVMVLDQLLMTWFAKYLSSGNDSQGWS